MLWKAFGQMSSQPLVDVLVPFHRNDSFLVMAIQSVKSSSNIQTRILAVNDTGQSINPKTIGLDEGDVLLNTVERGYTNALAVGIENSTADYVAFLDSDDLMHPRRLSLQLQLLLDDDLDFVSCGIMRMDTRGNMRQTGSLLGTIPNPHSRRELWVIGSHGTDSTLFARGETIRKNWKLHANFPAIFADYAWALSLPREIRFGHLDEPYYYYRSHSNQISLNPELHSNWDMVFPLWRENLFQEFPKLTLTFTLTANIALAIAFPAALPNLTRSESAQLSEFVGQFLALLEVREQMEYRSWKVTLFRRLLLASRGRARISLRYFPGLALTLVRLSLSGIQLRRIRTKAVNLEGSYFK
jgi:glycosyltransferase involved in cell wall biosynthesis